MSDRFVFRAWNPDIKKMLYIGEFELFFEVDNGLHTGGYGSNGDWVNHKLMQSTGLRDKNGKLIFEGDIVVYGYCNKSPFYAVCVYVDAKYQWEVHEYSGEDDPYLDCTFQIENDPLEVIGNKYENPELLECAE